MVRAKANGRVRSGEMREVYKREWGTAREGGRWRRLGMRGVGVRSGGYYWKIHIRGVRVIGFKGEGCTERLLESIRVN